MEFEFKILQFLLFTLFIMSFICQGIQQQSVLKQAIKEAFPRNKGQNFHNHHLTLWIRVLLQKPIVAKPFNKYPPLMNKKCYYPQAEGPLLFGRSQLRIKNIRSYAPYLEALSSIGNPRRRHVVVTGTHIHSRITFTYFYFMVHTDRSRDSSVV
jgi:hypothetical protein